MRLDQFRLQPIPPSLAKQPINLRHESGTWTLYLLGGQSFPLSSEWLHTAVKTFQQAFGWTSISELTFDRDSSIWRRGGPTLDEWFIGNRREHEKFQYLKADIDCELAWAAADGTIGRSVFQKSGRISVCLFDWEDDPPQPWTRVEIEFEIGLDLFCDSVWLNAVDRQHDMSLAASVNREQLRRSLHEWERLTTGVIGLWGSDRISGAERYGFCDACKESE